MRQYNELTDQRGSIADLYAIPLTSFLRFRHDYLTGLDHPEFRQRSGIIRIPVNEGAEWSEEEKMTTAGHLYTIKISGSLKKGDRLGWHLIRELECGTWLVLHVDTLGVCRISGTADVPMRFETTSGSGSSFSSKNSMSYTFSCAQAIPSVICSVDIPLI